MKKPLKKILKQKQTKPKFLNFQITDNIYQKEIDIYVGDRVRSEQIIRKKYNLTSKDEIFPVTWGGGTLFLETPDGDMAFIIWFSCPISSYIAHECMHATYYILHGLGLDLTDNTQEAYAYYMGFLCKEIYSHITK